MARIEESGADTLLVIEVLLVDSQIRSSGIGEAMMNELIERAKEAKCSGLESAVLPGDRHSKNFFESFGLKARLLTVHRRLN